MKIHSPLTKVLLLGCALALINLPRFAQSAEDEYSFTVHNTTKDKITQLLASEDGSDYGKFDIGKEGLAPGAHMKLTWDKSTNKSGCKWFFKAVFEDGSESKPVKFDFCEEGLELEF